MRIGVAAVCAGLLLLSVLSTMVPTARALDQDYLAYHDAVGFVSRVFDGSSTTYSKFNGDPNLLREYEPGDLPDYEYRGFWRFTIPDFTDKNVKDVKLEFRTRNAQCLPPPTCVGALSFKVDVFRLYTDPTTATPQQIFDGIHQYQGLPYLKGSLTPLDLAWRAQTTYSKSLEPNAVADINHHEGGWYALGMKIYEVRDGNNNPVWGKLEICSLSGCSYPPPGPGSLASKPGPAPLAAKPGPSPLYAFPVLKVTYEAAKVWGQLHGDARHNGFSASASPATGNSVWRQHLCVALPSQCTETDYSPVARNGYVYTVTLDLSGQGSVIHAFTYSGGAAGTRVVPGPSNEGLSGARSLAVSNDLLVKTDFWGPSPYTTTVRAYKPATDPSDPLGPLWTYPLPADEISRAGATIYGRYVFVGTEGGSLSTYGHLYLLESRGTTVSLIWSFTPPTAGDIATSAAVYKDTVLVRATTTLYAIPFVDPNENQQIEAGEVRWTLPLGGWSGDKYDPALSSGPSAKGGYAYIGSHAGAVYKIPVAGGGIPTWSFWAGARVQSTPAVGFGLVYVTTMSGPFPATVRVLALSDASGTLQYEHDYTNASVGRGSPSLAGNKVFIWLATSTTPAGNWVIALDWDLSSPGPYNELYRVGAGSGPWFGDLSSTPAIADGWVFTGDGDTHSFPPPDSYGFLIGWNS